MTDHIVKVGKLYADQVDWRSINGTVEDLVDGGHDITIKPQDVHSKGHIVHAKSFGVVADGLVDDSTALQAAMDYAYDNTVGYVMLPPGVMRCQSAIRLRPDVSVRGCGLGISIIESEATNYCLYADEKINGVVNPSRQNPVEIVDFQVRQKACSGTAVDMVDFQKGINASILRLRLVAMYGHTRHGLVIHGCEPGTSTANNNQYGNRIYIETSSDSEVTGTGLYLYGQDVSGARANTNVVLPGSRLDGFSTGMYCNGIGNVFVGLRYNGPAATAAVHLYGDSCYKNAFFGCYWDSLVSGDKVRLEYSGAATRSSPMGYFYACTGIWEEADFNDVSATSANYVSDTIRGYILSRRSGSTSYIHDRHLPGMRGQDADGWVGFSATKDRQCGRVICSGESMAEGDDCVSDNGGVTAVINDDADAEFRVVCAQTGPSQYNKLLQVDNDGNVTIAGDLSVAGSTTPGGVITDVINRASNHTLTAVNHTVVVDSSGGNRVMTLPAISSVGNGKEYVIIKKVAANTVRVDADAADTIEGNASITMNNQYDSITVVGYDTVWYEKAHEYT